MYRCATCNIVCSGIDNYRQHEASTKHKKKVVLNQHGNAYGLGTLSNFNSNTSYAESNFSCNTCSKLFLNLSELLTHSSSEEHALMILKNKSGNMLEEKLPCDSTSIISQSKCEPSMDSSSSSFQLNEKRGSYFSSPISVVSNYARCEPCAKTFSGPEPYQQHINSDKHKKKVSLQVSHYQPLAEVLQGMYCKSCDKSFSAPEYYQQHLESDDHKIKSVTVAEYSESVSKPLLNGYLKCEVCDIQLTGPIPYQQHLLGDTHKKNVNKKCSLNQFTTEGNNKMEVDFSFPSAIKKTDNLLPGPYYCEVCCLGCSGPDPFRQHLVSKKHIKKKSQAELESKRRDLYQQLSHTKDSNGSKFEINQQVKPAISISENSLGSDSFKDSGEQLKDALCGENLDLCVVNPSDLNLTLFKVGEPIDFDKKPSTPIKVSELDKFPDDETYEDLEEGEIYSP